MARGSGASSQGPFGGRAERAPARATIPVDLVRPSQELQRFAFIAAHELRTPLAAVAQYADMLERRFADQLPPAAADYLAGLTHGVAEMRALVYDLLALASVGREEPVLQPVAMATILRATLRELDRQIEETEAEIVTEGLPVINGDPLRLRRVLENLLSNALKFRAPKRRPRIEITSGEGEDGLCLISIADNGVGVADADRDRVFEIFERGTDSLARPGTGIGLALCKRIIEWHGGRIWVDPTPGGGATFHFTLPPVRDPVSAVA